MDKDFEKQFLESLELEKFRAKRRKKEVDEEIKESARTPRGIGATLIVSKREIRSYTGAVIRVLYRHTIVGIPDREGELVKKRVLTESFIKSQINPMARYFVSSILHELMENGTIHKLEVRGRIVYKFTKDAEQDIREKMIQSRQSHLDLIDSVVTRLVKEDEEEKRDTELLADFQKQEFLNAQQQDVVIEVQSEAPQPGDTPEDIFNCPSDYVKTPPKLKID